MKNSTILLVFVLLGFALLPLSATEGEILANSFRKVEVKDIVFQWNIDGENIDIILSAPTTGWIAVGFDPGRMMKDANIIIGYVENNEVFIRDDFGAGYTKHKADTDLGGTDDITIKGGSEINGKTTLEFSIPLHSLDSNDRILEQGEEYKLIFAYGKKDDFTSYHKFRTSIKVTL
jgi:hypothetical protein